MLTSLTIKNYKSIVDLTVELGRINVFIGENGCGKTNLLEGLAMLCAARSRTLGSEELYARGVRIAKPSITLSSFRGKDPVGAIHLAADEIEPNEQAKHWSADLKADADGDVYANWTDAVTDALRQKLDQWRQEIGTFEKNRELTVRIRTDRVSTDLSMANKFINSFLSELQHRPSLHSEYVIYNLNTQALRGIYTESRRQPLGVHGEGLDILISTFSPEEREQLLRYSHFISWLDDILFDQDDHLKFAGHKLGKSTSHLYFRDRFMASDNNVFSAENANEGVLHVLFYLTLFISKRTPALFGIDNIEQALNPHLCRTLIKELAQIAKENDKQALITTHNPAILDGLNLHDDEQRVFVVYRSDEGDTRVRRIKHKEHREENGHPLKLSELWMRGFLGGIPKDF